MRRAIETVPRDGEVVILEDDISGTYELAHWSAQEGAWVGESGKPCQITPTYWHAMRRADGVLEQRSSGPPNLQPQAVLPILSDRAEPRLPPLAPISDQAGKRLPPAARWPPVAPTSGRPEPQFPTVAPDIFAPGPIAKPAPPIVVTFDEKTMDERTGPDNAHPTRQRRRFALSAIGAAMVVASLMGMYFRAEVGAKISQRAGQTDHPRIGTLGGQVVPEIQLPTQQPQKTTLLERDAAFEQRPDAGKASDEAAQLKPTAETAELQQLLQRERDKTTALESQLAMARRDAGSQTALSSKTGNELAEVKKSAKTAIAELQQTLQQERDNTLALVSELARARRDLDSQTARLSETRNEAAQFKQAAKTAADLQQSLQQERKKTLALEGELAMARRDIEQAALSRKTNDEPGQPDQVAGSATAIQRQSVQQTREPVDRPAQLSKSAPDPADAFASGWFGRDDWVENRSVRSNQTNMASQTVGTAGAEELVAAKAKRDLEADRLMERADALLVRRYIGAARGVFARAAATGNAQATFRLAETYDPLVLSTWRAYRTRGDAKKARELYAKAYDGGIKTAKDRSDALELSMIPARSTPRR
jgi:hypothetical protein